MTTIDITSELKRFETHLENNPRTIFSAKFGDGKTYFLKEYVEQHKKDTLFITLHPINYSASSNEDVFEYIKRDILVELSKLPEFKEVNWKSVLETIFNYDNLLEECEFLSDTLPLTKAILTPFRLFKKVDDKFAIDKFFDHFAEMKGGIFEQDQYTIAIQATIHTIRETGKKCVLIIEDLDRIDPAHLFRILNVLGAHLDDENETNKFGFNNIVAVLDYKKTEHIFHHFYGIEANYNGYMAKFISHNIFEYSLAREAVNMLTNYLVNQCGIDTNAFEFTWHHDRRDGQVLTINDKLKTLSVRDVVNVMDELEIQYTTTPINVSSYLIDPQVPLVKMLAVMTRLNIQFEMGQLMEFVLQNSKRYQLMGAFLLSEPRVLYQSLKFGDEILYISEVETEGGKSDVRFQIVWGSEVSNYREYTLSILQKIINNVHDCKPLV